ncbi:hypothetical protein M3J09_012057 [Ascochyta lentis]
MDVYGGEFWINLYSNVSRNLTSTLAGCVGACARTQLGRPTESRSRPSRRPTCHLTKQKSLYNS